jgi:hypothetical protein
LLRLTLAPAGVVYEGRLDGCLCWFRACVAAAAALTGDLGMRKAPLRELLRLTLAPKDVI